MNSMSKLKDLFILSNCLDFLHFCDIVYTDRVLGIRQRLYVRRKNHHRGYDSSSRRMLASSLGKGTPKQVIFLQSIFETYRDIKRHPHGSLERLLHKNRYHTKGWA